MNHFTKSGLPGLTAEIVSAYVARNALPTNELPSLMLSVHEALNRIAMGPVSTGPKAEELRPAVPVKKSITDEYLISLESGKRFKSLKRHLMTSYSMTPQQYREKWGLPKDYPMVAPAYAKSRSALAKDLGLGRKANVPAAAESLPIPTPGVEKPRRAPRAKAA